MGSLAGRRENREARQAEGPGTASYRLAVVRCLLEEGVPVRALEALLPGWETEIATAIERRPGPAV